MDGELRVSISEFSDYPTRDRDNMAKPILDVLQGIVYKNDRQVTSLNVDWRDLNGRFIVRYMSPVVAASLSEGHEFVWVRVSPGAAREDLIA